MMAWRGLAVAVACALTVAGYAAAQSAEDAETTLAEPTRAEPAPAEPTLFERTIEADISTATTQELLDWARSLGVDTRGRRDEIEARMLESYGVERGAFEPAPDDGPTSDRAPRGTTTARISSARGSRFFTLEAPDEQYVRLFGGVELLVEDGDALHRIEADEIHLNLDRNTLDARGNVRYSVDRSSGREEFRGDSVLFALNDWAGVFLGGITETGETTEDGMPQFTVVGGRITRSPEQVIVVEDGSITSSRADPPNYRIAAERLWLLAPGEWGLRNVVLYVGRVPLLAFPVFFLPGDRLFFSPSISVRERAGLGIQTTTYLIGQGEESDPPLSLLQLAEPPDDADRVIDGLFLRVPESAPPPDPVGWSVKAMADAYTTLGAYAGIDAQLADLGPLSRLGLRLGIARSQAIYLRGGRFTNFRIESTNGGGVARQYVDPGWVLGREIPLRGEVDLSAAARFGSLSLDADLLFLTDPDFRRDFGGRMEGMDWSFIFNPTTQLGGGPGSTVATTPWRARLRWTPTVGSLAPWVSSFAIDPVRLELDWATRQTASDRVPEPYAAAHTSPALRFLYPSVLTIPDVALRARGTIISLGGRLPTAPQRGGVSSERDTLDLRAPWDTEGPGEESSDGSGDDSAAPRLPAPVTDVVGGVIPAPTTLSLSWQLDPSARINRFLDSGGWDEPADVALDWRSTTLQSRIRGSLVLRAAAEGQRAILQSTVAVDRRDQETVIESDLTEAERTALLLDAARARLTTVTQSGSLTLNPFLSSGPFAGSSVTYTLANRLYDSRFLSMDDAGPTYSQSAPSWTPEAVSTHSLSAAVRSNFWDAPQSLTVAATLPPTLERYSASLALATGPLVSTFSTALLRADDGALRFGTLQQSHRLQMLDGLLVASQRVDYDLEPVGVTLSDTTLRFGPLAVALSARRTIGSRFVAASGWVSTTDQALRLTSGSLSLDLEREIVRWKRRVRLELFAGAHLTADFQRFTASRLVLDYGLTLSIFQFLDLTFRARSRNDLIYQYVPVLAETVGRPARNALVDILESVNVFDTAARERALFKIDSFSVELEHDLQDWVLTVAASARPEIDRTGVRPTIRWANTISILVRWRPIEELEREVRIQDGELASEL